MTGWQALQWLLGGFGTLSGAASFGWVWTQGRKLHDEERARRETEDQLLRLIDGLSKEMVNGYASVPPEMRKAAMLGRGWRALDVKWDRGDLQVRLTNFGDHVTGCGD
jgi:hypothetical protein